MMSVRTKIKVNCKEPECHDQHESAETPTSYTNQLIIQMGS